MGEAYIGRRGYATKTGVVTTSTWKSIIVPEAVGKKNVIIQIDEGVNISYNKVVFANYLNSEVRFGCATNNSSAFSVIEGGVYGWGDTELTYDPTTGNFLASGSSSGFRFMTGVRYRYWVW
jgi:hypothetical protein